MQIQDSVSVGGKTTMRIGGKARHYAELKTREDVEQAYAFAKEKSVPLIALGGGSNTVFADGDINAFVVRLKADAMKVNGNRVFVEAGKILASLLNDLAKENLDLSALTGIPGTVGGAIFGNAGQGPTGIWINTYVKHVTVFLDGTWRTLTAEECDFRYRESLFKDAAEPPLIWEAELEVPSKPGADVLAEIERLLKKRFETQPHIKTAGSCFKALPDGTPAWKLIDAAGLRGHKEGGVQIAEKHANFLLNVDKATFADIVRMSKLVKQKVPQIAEIEMRLYGEDGRLVEL
jgi:UDP-N-acetylmuramate dehydrogenase